MVWEPTDRFAVCICCSCEWGLVSQNGWAIVDDSQNTAWDSNDWWQSQNVDSVDLYFFGYGWNYKQAIGDYTKFGGVMSMVPRFAHGVWWTRWFDFGTCLCCCLCLRF